MKFSINTLYQIVLKKLKSKETNSYTRSLSNEGIPRIAQKLGEESVELIIEVIKEKKNKKKIINESADLLFHYLVLLANCKINLDDVFKELEKRHVKKSSLAKMINRR